MIKLWKLKTSELIFKRMFLTSKRRRQGEDRPHTTVDRCWEVSPRCIYERQYKFVTAANPINYCSKVLALLPRIYIYICNNVLFSLRGNYSTYIYIQLYRCSYIVIRNSWAKHGSASFRPILIFMTPVFFIHSQPLQSLPFYQFFFLSTTIT